MNKSAIQNLVNNFVDQLYDLMRQEALAVFGEGRRNGHSNGHSNGSNGVSGRGRGEKRTAEELDALAEQFVAFVGKNPGLRIEQIHKQLGTSTKELALPIRKMISEGRLKVKGHKRSTTYFVGKS